MGAVLRRAVVAAALTATAVGAQRTTAAALPASHLAVAAGGGWSTWWTAAAAPATWDGGDLEVTRAVVWHPAAAGMEWGELELAGSGEAWRTRVILVRLDLHRVRFRVDSAFGSPPRPGWSLARVPRNAVFAINAGQFVSALPWGWVVIDGREVLPRGRGPLAVALVGDSAGALHWIPADSLDSVRPGHVAWAFESYPELLRGGTVPEALRAAGRGVDVGHRDARLALGRLRDGRLLVALTRFDALGSALGAVPFGPTVPEMAALMGALGCRDAVLLDGGISAQLLVRDAAGRPHEWKGVRKVPLALLAIPR